MMERIKRLAAGTYTLAVSTIDDDGNAPVISEPGVVLTDGAGTEITGVPAPSAATSGVLSVAVPVSVMPLLDIYHCEWTGTVSGNLQSWSSDHELVGGHLCEIAEIRAADRAFADAAKYPTALLRAMRDAVAEQLEGPRFGRVNFAPRGRRVVTNGSGPDFFRGYSPLIYGQDVRRLVVPDVALLQLYSCSIFGVAMDPATLAEVGLGDNYLYLSAMFPPWPYGVRNIALHYACGYERTPGPISRAAVILCREYLLGSSLPSQRATATTIGDQMFRVSIAGRDGATGLPDVDAAVDQFGRKHYGVG